MQEWLSGAVCRCGRLFNPQTVKENTVSKSASTSSVYRVTEIIGTGEIPGKPADPPSQLLGTNGDAQSRTGAKQILTFCQYSVNLSTNARCREIEVGGVHGEVSRCCCRALHLLQSSETRSWTCIEDVRNVYPSADAVKVKSGRTLYVFNIRGNRYRFICAMHFNRKRYVHSRVSDSC